MDAAPPRRVHGSLGTALGGFLRSRCLLLATLASWLPLVVPPPPAQAQPRLVVTPARLDVAVAAGDSTTAVLTLAGPLEAPLGVTLGVRPPDPAAGGLRLPLPDATALLGDRRPGADEAAGSGRAAQPRVWPEQAGPRTSPAMAPHVAAPGGPDLLIIGSGGDVSTIRAQLAALGDFGRIDTWDLLAGPPTLAELQRHACVLVTVNSPRFDPGPIGDALADYVDGGGGLVLTLASFEIGYEVGGRLLREGYHPFRLGGGPGSTSTLAAADPRHPVMAGITHLEGDLLADLRPEAAATLLASWADGRPCVAVRGAVVAVNVFVALPGFAGGQVAELLRNALLWSTARASWLRLPATRVVLEPGAERVLELTLDARALDAGPRELELLLTPDDPAVPAVRVPIRLDVQGVPAVRVSGGQARLVSAIDFFEQGQETVHRIAVPAPFPDTLRVELTVEGDFGDGGELATMSLEGLNIGGAGQNGFDCTPITNGFSIGRSLTQSLLADGVVEARVRNTTLVDPLCAINRHTVRVLYDRGATPLRIDSVFVGASRLGELGLVNVGSAPLHVTELRSNDPTFTPLRDSITVPPHARSAVPIRFTPRSVGDHGATLTFASDDPARPVVEVDVAGRGLVPPEAVVSPPSVAAAVAVGGVGSGAIRVENHGGSPLGFQLRARGTVRVLAPPRGGGPPEPPGGWRGLLAARPTEGEPGPGAAPRQEPEAPSVRTSQPSAVAAPPSARVAMPGARVLIVQDFAPWNTVANETALSSLGAAFDVATTSDLDTLELSRYRVVVIASDQTMLAYRRLADHARKFETFVGAGGVLEAHVAGWGTNGGDASVLSLPGGVQVTRRISDLDRIVRPDHPLAANAPLELPGTSASHAWLPNLPPSADVVAVDDAGFPVLAAWSLGRGMVVATGMTIEFEAANGQAAAPLLENMLRYALEATPRWLTFEPARGVVPPGGALPVALRFDAAAMDGGDYAAELDVLTDDPAHEVLPVEVSLHVTGAPDLEVAPRVVVDEAHADFVVNGAVNVFRVPVDRPRGTPIALEVEVIGDFDNSGEEALVTVEGFVLGSVSAPGQNCGGGRRSFLIAGAFADQVLADDVLEVEVRNAIIVDPFCDVNRHTVRVGHVESPFPLRFRDARVGACDARSFVLRNRGSEPLHVRALSSDGADFTATPGSVTLAPREEQVVLCRFCPERSGDATATLRVESDDPDTPLATLTLIGRGLPPPRLELDDTPIALTLLVGEQATRSFNVHNVGEAPLALRFLPRAGSRAAGPAGAAVGTSGAPTSAPAGAPAALLPGPEPPAGPADAGTSSRRTSRDPAPTARVVGRLEPMLAAVEARVLLVEDLAPWGGLSLEALLEALGMPFDRVTAAGVASRDLSRYALVLLAGDQDDEYYATLARQAERLTAFVQSGGVLEAHLTGWGSNNGNASLLTLPGGIRARQRLSLRNLVVAPGHPTVRDVPSSFTGSFASHADLLGIPTGSLVVVTDDTGGPTLVVSPQGAGLVVVGTHPYEFALSNGGVAATIVRNLLPYSFTGPAHWLSVAPDRSTLGIGGSLAVTASIDAAALVPGRYDGEVTVFSDDPRAAFRSVPVTLLAAVPAGLSLTEGARRSLAGEGGGRHVDVRLRIAGRAVADVRVASVTLNGVPADTAHARLEGGDGEDEGGGPGDDGAPAGRDGDTPADVRSRLRLRFDLEAVRATLPASGEAPLELAGLLAGGDAFLARDTLRLAGRRDRADDAAAMAPGTGVPTASALRLGPNPFRAPGALQLELSLARAGHAEVRVFSPSGRLVRVVSDRALAPGVHALAWDGRDDAGRAAPAGVYLVRVRAPGLATTRRVALVR